VAKVDLMDPDAGLVGGYDGAHHSGAARRSADHVHAENLEALGLTVVRVAACDLTEFRARTFIGCGLGISWACPGTAAATVGF
jgi:very-short-patch-repair endonuclease